MRNGSLCALAFAFGCSTPSEEPLGGIGGVPGSGGGAVTSSGGAASATGGTTSGGLPSGGASNGGSSASGASNGNGGLFSGGVSNGGNGGSFSGGASKGGSTSGGATGGTITSGGNGAGMFSGGAVAGASNGGKGGRSSGGTAGTATSGGTATGGKAATGGNVATGGSGGAGGGTGGCVKNLACKLAAPPSTGDIHQDCVDRINQFLTQCACLPALARRTDGEACADQMAEYDAAKNSPHAGVIDNICQPGGSQNSCPGYASNAQVIGLCMQQMWDEGPPPTSSCTGTCYEEHGHFINMTEKGITKVACGFYTTSSGKVSAVQNFSR